MNNLQKILGSIMVIMGIFFLVFTIYKSYYYFYAGEDFLVFLLITFIFSLLYLIPGLLLRKLVTSKVLAVVIFIISLIMILVIPLTRNSNEFLPGTIIYEVMILLVYIPPIIMLLVKVLAERNKEKILKNNSVL